ncbi:MAG TPA: ABC transporter permease [Actinophytocola sp.]|jgi:ABC-2 type transport system permease protein|uniref:ABC transporter permease n=1 Tax=Actinophytocola sp. TaxID=1872138 RepID=UPI002DFCBAAA|nr:ABC transporter permease [Actinophytocola sp.]
MTAFTGTRALVRLALRRDRIILPVWIVLLAALPASGAGAYEEFYPTAADRAALAAGTASNPSVSLMYGRAFDVTTLGGFIAWRYGVIIALFTALLAIFMVTRHTRAEEDTGRLELIGSTVAGRYAALTAAAIVSAGTGLAIGLLITLTLIGNKAPAGGAVALGLGIAAAALVFTGVAVVTAQLTEYSRTANGLASAVLGAAFLLRAVGDSTTGATWLSWLSPLGWTSQVRAFAGERWWVPGMALAVAVILGVVGYRLVPLRDVGAGLLPPRPGPARAAASLRSPLGLAARLQRGSLVAWVAGAAVIGGVFGSIASGVGDLVGDNEQVRKTLEGIGGASGLVNAFLATMAGLYGLMAAAYGVQATLRMRTEEIAFRAEPVLATGVSRWRYTFSHLTFALLGGALILAAAGVATGLSHGLRSGDIGQFWPVLGGALAQLPAAWVVAGIATVLFGLVPRVTTAAWAALTVFLLLSWFGALLKLPQAVLDVSPFTHVPRLPGTAFTATPILWLTAIAVVALAAGLVGFRRRDVVA